MNVSVEIKGDPSGGSSVTCPRFGTHTRLCVCVCVWMLTKVAQIATAAHRDLQSCMRRLTKES